MRVCATRVGKQGAVVVAVLESLGASKLATDPQLATTLLRISITSVASVATMCASVRACVWALLSHRWAVEGQKGAPFNHMLDD